MAVALGYGGLANTNGARSFSGKVEADIVVSGASRMSVGMSIGIHGFILVMGRALIELGGWW